jgi:hypothetical protein
MEAQKKLAEMFKDVIINQQDLKTFPGPNLIRLRKALI